MALFSATSRSVGPAILVLAGLCAAGSLLTASAADSDPGHPELKLSAAGLDLGTPEGAGMFFGRLIAAADAACGVVDKRDIERATVHKHCYDLLIANEIRTINRGPLTHVYVTRFPTEAAQFGISEDRVAAK